HPLIPTTPSTRTSSSASTCATTSTYAASGGGRSPAAGGPATRRKRNRINTVQQPVMPTRLDNMARNTWHRRITQYRNQHKNHIGRATHKILIHLEHML